MKEKPNLIYGTKDKILNTNDINYMFSIINSDLSDIDKAQKLYSFCNCYMLTKNFNMYKTLELEETQRLRKLKIIYEQYNKKGYFDLTNNPYKCSLEEIEIRLIKLNKAIEIVNSDMNDYAKSEDLLKLYPTAEELRKSYSLFVKFGKNDQRLDNARYALDNFDFIYNTFKILEEKGVIDTTKYILNNIDYFENYQYANFVITNYILSSESYKDKEFLSKLGIDKEIFEFCVNTIKELEVELYKKYEVKKCENAKIRHVHNVMTIKTITEGIKKGILPDGTPFDMLEFFKRVPFKNSQNFIKTIAEFTKKNNPKEFKTFMTYIYSNKLNIATTFKLLNLKELYEVRAMTNSVEITKEDNDAIIGYLKLNNIPIVSKTYILARNKYLNGEFTAETIRKQKQEILTNKIMQKTLIPKIRNLTKTP